MPKLAFVVTEDWYFLSHRLGLGEAAKKGGYDVTVITRCRGNAHAIADAGLKNVNFEMQRRSMSFLGVFSEALRLRGLLLKCGPDIVHLVALRPVVVGGLASLVMSRPKFVYALTAKQNPRWQLRIIGEGARKSSLEALCRELSLEKRVAMPGVSRNISEEYQSADLFVIPSRYEAFGMVTAEALSYGLPAVGFADCPGTNTLIKHGVNGLLAESREDRAQALAAQLSRIMGNADLRNEMAKHARNTLGSRHNLKTVCDQWESII